MTILRFKILEIFDLLREVKQNDQTSGPGEFAEAGHLYVQLCENLFEICRLE